jgi:hypothetical protein
MQAVIPEEWHTGHQIRRVRRLLFDELLGVLDTEVITDADREDHD